MSEVKHISISTTSKANKSFRWTALAEIMAKIIAPVINMVLARFISPEIFGVVATLSVVTGLATTLSESGFARYVQQHQFSNDDERKISNRTSLTSSVAFGIILFSAIAIWCAPISSLIGASGYEKYLIVAASAIPFHSIISVETAILKRDFRFKETAFIRVGSTIVTASAEIVLGVLGYGLIALTWGQLISSALLAITLFFFLKDKRIIGFSFKFFKQSFVDNFLFIIESLCIWLVSALDVLLLGNAFGESLVGVYKLAFNTEKGIIALLGAVFSPVLISLFSKFSYEDPEFKIVLKNYQKAISFLSLPVGIGMLVFREGLTNIFLGSGWESAIPIFGFFAMFDCIKTPISDFISTLMISKGKPLGSIISQIIYISFVALCCAFAPRLGFDTFVILRASCTLLLILSYTFLCKPFTGISPWGFYKNLLKPFCGSLVMAVCCLPFSLTSTNVANTIIGVFIGAACYFAFMHFVFPNESRNFFSIVLDKKINFSKIESIKIFKKKVRVSTIRAIFASVFVLPLALSISFLSSNNVSVKQIAESFDICETASRQGENGLSRLELSASSGYFRDNLSILKDSISFANTHSKWPDYYNFYLTDRNEKKYSFKYSDKSYDAGIISLYSTYVAGYAKNDLGQPRMETGGLYVLVESRINQGFNNPIYISKKFADYLLDGSGDYASLIGNQIACDSTSYQISNIIADSTWMNSELDDEFGLFVIVAANTIFDYNTKLVVYFTNQPFVVNDYFALLSNSNYEKYNVSVVSKIKQNGEWIEIESHTNEISNIIYYNNANKTIIWDKNTYFSICLIVGISLIELFVLFAFTNSLFFAPSFVDCFSQSLFILLAGGLIIAFMNLIYKKYSSFFLLYAYTFGIPTLLLAIVVPITTFVTFCIFKKGARKI